MTFARDQIMGYILENSIGNKDASFTIPQLLKHTSRSSETSRRILVNLIEQGYVEKLPKVKREHSRRFRFNPKSYELLLSNPLQWNLKYFKESDEK